MAVLKCNVCGGELEVNADMSVGICKYCGSVITIPREIDRKEKLYNRAVFLRQNNEFDKAVSAYEDILKEDNSDAEAHWGLVLSKYGIEYVLDNRTNEWHPTCHRTQTESILADPDYLAALEYSDPDAQMVLKKEGEKIHQIQNRILEISKQESPYDIFICYKEEDERGDRTEDSTIAQDLYYELEKKGYKVFFARKTLKLGMEYEPIIYSALSSAKVMVVVGTRVEYFNAVWVRNEWSRFLKMNQGGDKMVIPAYKGLSPYELPPELSSLQSLDMSKIGFMQELTDSIERFMHGEKKERFDEGAAFGVKSLERLLKNGQTYLKLHNYTAAEENYETITRDYPEDYRGWWGLIVSKTREFSDIEVDQTSLDEWFGYVRQLAAPEEYGNIEKVYQGYIKKAIMPAVHAEMQEVQKMIEQSGGSAAYLQQAIYRAESVSRNRNVELQQKISNSDNRVRQFESVKAMNSNWSTGWMMKLSVAIGLILLSIWMFAVTAMGHDRGTSAAFGIFLLIIAIVILTKLNSKGSNSMFKQNIVNAENGIKQEAINRKFWVEENQKKLIADNKEIEGYKKEIERIQKKIEKYREYLECGEFQIGQLLYYERCRTLGMVQTGDKTDTVIKCRQRVFGDRGKQNENGSIIKTCPACGKVVILDGKDLEQGRDYCPDCGNLLVKKAN